MFRHSTRSRAAAARRVADCAPQAGPVRVRRRPLRSLSSVETFPKENLSSPDKEPRSGGEAPSGLCRAEATPLQDDQPLWLRPRFELAHDVEFGHVNHGNTIGAGHRHEARTAITREANIRAALANR